MYWSNFLHIYQPPTQTEEIVRKVTEECYKKLVKVMEGSPHAKITLNISAVLTQQLARYGYTDVIQGLKELSEKGQVEFTGSAIYHPILPLIPKDEVIRQIKLNTEVNQRYFGETYSPRGFFPPEMCYSFEVAEIVSELGFSWIIVDELSFNGKIGMARKDTIYKVEGLDNFKVFFKERPISAGIAYGDYPDYPLFIAAIEDKLDTCDYLLTGTDGEIYGHHRQGQEKLLEEAFAQGIPRTCTISEMLGLFDRVEEISPLPSSWSTWEDEMAHNIPYPQWSYPGHEIHQLQWQLTELAIRLVHKAPQDLPGYTEARHLLDEGLHSCQYWWASCRPWWDTGMVEAGAQKLNGAIELVKDALSGDDIKQAALVFQSLVAVIWQWQETGKAQALGEKYLEEHREVTSKLTFGQQ